MYYLLTQEFKEQEKELVKIIREAVVVDSIYLLGSTLNTRRTESIFMMDAPSCRYVGHYYLLILIDGSLIVNQVQDKIENTCRNFIPVTAIVLHKDQFKDWLSNGHYFASSICHKAVMLYGEVLKVSTIAVEEVNKRFEKERILVHYKGINLVNEFLAGVELYQVRKQNELATFMLHQATENALQTMLKTIAGLYISTHNLDKLIRYCSMISYTIPELLPRTNEKYQKIFSILQEGYIESRYKENFSINANELLKLKEIVVNLQKLAASLILQKS